MYINTLYIHEVYDHFQKDMGFTWSGQIMNLQVIH